MKCNFCGADVNQNAEKCDYCGSFIDHPKDPNAGKSQEQMVFEKYFDKLQQARERERQSQMEWVLKAATTNPQEVEKTAKSMARGITITVMIIMIIIFASIACGVVYTFRSAGIIGNGIMKNTVSSDMLNMENPIPKSQHNLYGEVIHCDRMGNASIRYNGGVVEKVIVSDQRLLLWLEQVNRNIDNVAICFDTDAYGNIEQMGLQSSPFVIIDKQDNVYTAKREDQIIQFESEEALELDKVYEGYFDYPGMRLHEYKESSMGDTVIFMDPTCDKKESLEETVVYRDKSVTVYRICFLDTWYYCSKDIYDSLEEGAVVSDYQFYSNPNCLVRK